MGSIVGPHATQLDYQVRATEWQVLAESGLSAMGLTVRVSGPPEARALSDNAI